MVYSCGREPIVFLVCPDADGTFVVRPTKQGGERDHCFTLSIIFKGRVFHVAMRRRKDNKWALGPERPDEQVTLIVSIFLS